MARSKSFKFIFALGLLSGTINSLTLKVAYQTQSVGLDGVMDYFHKPWFMSFVMFLSMFVALGVYGYQTYLRPPTAETKKLTWKMWLIVSGPSMFDMIGSSLQQIGLIFTPVSVYQMLKGSILLFSAALSVLFLNRHMYLHNWVGVASCTVALCLVGLSGVMSVESQPMVVSWHESVVGIAFIVGGQIICASQYVVEEFLLKPPNDMPATALVGLEGFWGSTVMGFVLLPLFQYALPGGDVGGVYENTRDTLVKLESSSMLCWVLATFFVSIFVFNICGVMVTQQASAVHHTFLDATRTIFIWLASVALYYGHESRSLGEPLTAWSLVQATGFVLLLWGECLYDGLLPLPFGLSKTYRVDPLRSPLRAPAFASPRNAASPNGRFVVSLQEEDMGLGFADRNHLSVKLLQEPS